MLIAVSFTACKKNDTPRLSTPVASIMAFNLASDQPAVGFSLSGSNLSNAPLDYNSFTGVYLPIYTGSRELRSFDYRTGSTLAIANGNFADSAYYSAFLMGANGSYRNVLVADKLDSLVATNGKAYIRYVNAIADSSVSPLISIEDSGENDVVENAAYGTVSVFRPVNAGPVTTVVNSGDSISASRVIALEENKVYTLLISGLPAAADTAQGVQIRFVQNGTITQ